jgi:hypothetical protein
MSPVLCDSHTWGHLQNCWRFGTRSLAVPQSRSGRALQESRGGHTGIPQHQVRTSRCRVQRPRGARAARLAQARAADVPSTNALPAGITAPLPTVRRAGPGQRRDPDGGGEVGAPEACALIRSAPGPVLGGRRLSGSRGDPLPRWLKRHPHASSTGWCACGRRSSLLYKRPQESTTFGCAASTTNTRAGSASRPRG